MNEHVLFLQAAGSDFHEAHALVTAVSDAIRAPHDERPPADMQAHDHQQSLAGAARPRGRLGAERIARHVERAGFHGHEGLLVALAAHATVASPLSDIDLEWIASASARIDDEALLIESAGVVFAFNTINRIADARRVRLEYRFLRELKPIRSWIERRMAALIGMAYDLSYQHRARHTSAELLQRLGVLFESLGSSDVPDVFRWLGRSPVVLEGVLEMLEASVGSSSVRLDLFKEAAAIGAASRAMPDSGLVRSIDQWLSRGSLPYSDTLCLWAARTNSASADLVSACRRYAWHVANAPYKIGADQIREMSELGLSDAELLDLTLAAAIFSALAIIETIGAAVAPGLASQSSPVPPDRRSASASSTAERNIPTRMAKSSTVKRRRM